MPELICVRIFLNRPEAELAKNILDIEGIASVVSADDCGGLRPDIGFGTGSIRLLVDREDYEEARRVLKMPEDEEG